MKRVDLERLKAELQTHYAERLEQEQTHLNDDQRAHMCIGFEHGLGWFTKLLASAGLKLEEEDEPTILVGRDWRSISPCMRCRVVANVHASVVVSEHEGKQFWECPTCGAENERP